MRKAGIVVCSNGLNKDTEKENQALEAFLKSEGTEVTWSECIYDQFGGFSGTPAKRAEELMKMFSDPQIEEIYDISGGDMANHLLDHLDYDRIRSSKAAFWGYSDLTTIINAIYTMTGKASVLYQIKNTVRGSHCELQQNRYRDRSTLFDVKYQMIQGEKLSGIVVGGNIRCFLKLAGTKYFPDLTGKVLLLESMNGEVPQMSTCLAQLSQMGAFEKINGILLGTFTVMDRKHIVPDMAALVRQYAKNLPIAKTADIGHGSDAKAIMIGKEIS